MLGARGDAEKIKDLLSVPQVTSTGYILMRYIRLPLKSIMQRKPVNACFVHVRVVSCCFYKTRAKTVDRVPQTRPAESFSCSCHDKHNMTNTQYYLAHVIVDNLPCGVCSKQICIIINDKIIIIDLLSR